MPRTGALCVLLLCCAAAAADEAATILDEGGFWRFHVTMRRPTVGGEVLPVRVAYRHYPGIEHVETAPPPEGWARCDFDDASWPRARAVAPRMGSIEDVAFAPGVRFSTGRLSLRGKFIVRDPEAVGSLALSMKYRGGVVAYLNGREIARQDLPDGDLDPNAPGSPYPAEAFVDAGGEPIPCEYDAAKRIRAGEKNLAERIAGRDRGLGPVRIPPRLLRKGMNVLAIELRRSDYHDSAKQWFISPRFERHPAWVPNGLLAVRLSATGAGAVPNVSRPDGVQVWNHDLNDRVHVQDYGDSSEALRPIRIEAARNGAFSGMVVIGSRRPLRGLKALAGDQQYAGGGNVIPASCVQVRFGHPDGRADQRPDWFDGLLDTPPAEVPAREAAGAVLPVWVTVNVPRDAAAGDYCGPLALSVG
ncbi:MAG: hypothetical protein WBF17_02365, partial [Phycisphaerae bacterium]